VGHRQTAKGAHRRGHQITGSILDVGRGTGENALFFASRGQKVKGIDFLAEPITKARKKTAERGVKATFFVMDALALKDLPEVSGSVIDSGLFHVFNDEDRPKYGSVWLGSNGFSECAAESRLVRLKPVARGATLMRRGRISGAIDRRLRYAVAEVPDALGPVPGRRGDENAPALTRHQGKGEAARDQRPPQPRRESPASAAWGRLGRGFNALIP
jgi:SAM-dependent methyltransferase